MYVIKADIADEHAARHVFDACKTMYGGKRIAAGDRIYLFASETSGGRGLIARGVVTAARALPLNPALARQTPRVSIRVEREATARRRLGRDELRAFRTWDDGRPETELNFKLYRQSTNKVVGISDAAVAFLDTCFA